MRCIVGCLIYPGTMTDRERREQFGSKWFRFAYYFSCYLCALAVINQEISFQSMATYFYFETSGVWLPHCNDPKPFKHGYMYPNRVAIPPRIFTLALTLIGFIIPALSRQSLNLGNHSLGWRYKLPFEADTPICTVMAANQTPLRFADVGHHICTIYTFTRILMKYRLL